jgi:hypothetical protein
MSAIDQEFESRKEEIRAGLEMLFKANMTITDWDIPEVDDREAAKRLAAIIQEALDEIKADIEAGKYDYY